MCAETWESRWVPSTFKSGDEGKWDTSAGKFYGDAENKGLHTTTDYRWCANLLLILFDRTRGEGTNRGITRGGYGSSHRPPSEGW